MASSHYETYRSEPCYDSLFMELDKNADKFMNMADRSRENGLIPDLKGRCAGSIAIKQINETTVPRQTET